MNIEQLKALAGLCISVPLSRSIAEVEQAGEAILELLDGIAELEDMNAQLREQNTAVDQACADLERELEAVRKDAEWRSIDTAPDSMSEVVVVRFVNSDGEECHEFDYKEDGCWIRWHEHAEHVEVIGGHGVSYTPPYVHWMPLPPAPDAAKEQG